MIRRLMQRSLMASFFAVPLAGAALAQAPAPTPIPGGTAVLLVGQIDTLNPTINTGAANGTAGCLMHDGLVELKGDGSYEPALAKSWTITPDNLTYTFDLVETNWHDGKPFTSEDVEYFMRAVTKYAPLISAQVGSKIKEVKIIDPHKISVTLSEPYGPFLSMLACFNGGAMLPKHLYDNGTLPASNPVSRAPVGTGAYKFVEWKDGEFVRVVKNPTYYRKGLPYLDGVVVRQILSASARVQALMAGEGDFIQRFYLPPNDINTVKNRPGFKVVQSSSPPNVTYVFFNTTKKPLDDKRVRQALFQALDRNFITQAVYSGHGQPARGPYGYLLGWAANLDIDYDKMYPTNVDAANKKLDDAGYPRGADGNRFKISITFPNDTADDLALSTAMQEAWKKVGVVVELRSLARTVLTPKVFEEKDFDVTPWVYTTYGDPAIGVARTWISASIGRPFGAGSQYRNAKVDELFAKGAAATKLEDRAAFYKEVSVILAEDLPVMTVFETKGFDGMNDKIEGIFGFMSNGRWSHAWFRK